MAPVRITTGQARRIGQCPAESEERGLRLTWDILGRQPRGQRHVEVGQWIPVAAITRVEPLADRALVQADASGRRMATLRQSVAPPAYAGPPLTVVDLLVGPQGLVLPADPQAQVLYRVVKPAPSGAGER